MVYADYVNILGTYYKENTEALVVANKLMLIKLNTWPCVEIRMQDEVTI